jgi:hypothetical protein
VHRPQTASGDHELLVEKGNGRDRLERMPTVFESPDSPALLERVGRLSNVDFDRLTKARKAGRRQAAGKVQTLAGLPHVHTTWPKM